MPSRGTIAASQYANTAEIAERAGWFQAGSSQPITNVTALLGELNGDWIDLTSNSSNQGIQRRFIPNLVNATRQLELTSAVYFSNVTTPSANSDMMRLGVGSSTATPNLVLEPRANPDTGLNDRLFIARRNSTTTDYFDTGVDIVDQGVLYTTLRMIAASGAGVADGSAEVWINGNRVYFETGINWSSSSTSAEFTSLCYASVTSAAGCGTMYRSVMVNDTLTTGFGTAPEYKHVVGAEVNNVVATAYTNEGGAATTVEAVTDGLDTTYLETALSGEVASFDFAIPASLASQPIRDVQVRLAVSRGNATFNDIDVEIRNGPTVVGTSVESLTAVDPTRELVEPIFVPSAATNLDEVIVAVRNGS